MTFLADSPDLRTPRSESGALCPPGPQDVGRTVLYALDGDGEIDLGNLAEGQDIRATAQIDGRTHLVRITEARCVPESGSEHTVIMLPGLLERVDSGPGGELHEALAAEFPNSRLASIATDGVGPHRPPLSLREAWELGFDTMAADRLQLAEAVASGPVTLVGISLGSILALLVALRNLNHDTPPIHIRHAVDHSHALVPPGNVPKNVLLQFVPHMLQEMLRKSQREGMTKMAAVRGLLGSVALHAPHMVSYGSNIKNVVRGTKPAKLFKVAEAIPMTFISGEGDPLGQKELLDYLQASYPDTVRVMWLPDVGHSSCLEAGQVAAAIAAAERHVVARTSPT